MTAAERSNANPVYAHSLSRDGTGAQRRAANLAVDEVMYVSFRAAKFSGDLRDR